MTYPLIYFFYDPLLRAPTIGSMLMGSVSALIGVLLFVRKHSLLGEAISHATYPGIMLSLLFVPFLGEGSFVGLLVGAFCTAWLGLEIIERLGRQTLFTPDSALCLTLSLLLGWGVTIASRLQFIHPSWYQRAQLLLYGQAATMRDVHIFLYGGICVLVILFLLIEFRQIELIFFDPSFLRSLNISTRRAERMIHLLLIIIIVLGIRSVGVILMSGMLIAPVSAARQWTHRFSCLFLLSGVFGLCSGFFGNYLSVALPTWIGVSSRSFPTGPMILLCACTLSLFSFLFAFRKGACSDLIRFSCLHFCGIAENLLKSIGDHSPAGGRVDLGDVLNTQSLSWGRAFLILVYLHKKRWIRGGLFCRRCELSETGRGEAQRLRELHYLWTLYLFFYRDIKGKAGSLSSREMARVLTKEVRENLARLDRRGLQVSSTGADLCG